MIFYKSYDHMNKKYNTINKSFKKFLVPILTLLLMITSVSVQAESARTNLALGKYVIASTTEAPTLSPDKAVDGIVDHSSRWATAWGDQDAWLQVDLGEEVLIDGFNVEWERYNVLDYEILVSSDGVNFESIVRNEGMIESLGTSHDLISGVKARYVKLAIHEFQSTGEDRVGENVDWNTVSVYEFEIFGNEIVRELTNIALNKPATASGDEGPNIAAEFAVDGNVNTRWGSEYSPSAPFLQVDLGEVSEIHSFNINWERLNINAYEIQVSNDGEVFETVVSHEGTIEDFDMSHELDAPVSGRYVKVDITDWSSTGLGQDGKSVDYPTVSIHEFEVIGYADVVVEPEEPGDTDPEDMNYALNRPAFSSGDEASTLTPNKAVDGIGNTDRSSRWASDLSNGHKWLSVDLQKTRSIRTFMIEWERRNSTDYELQVSDDNVNWTTVAEFDAAPRSRTQRVVLDEAVEGRYIRVYISAFDATAEGVTWNNVSIYEFEAYGIELAPTFDEIVELLDMPIQTLDMDTIALPTYEDATIEFYGADYNYVIDKDGTIYHPIVDTIVNVNLEVTINGETSISPDLPTLVKGTLNSEDSINEKPVVVPALVEWFGYEGEIAIDENTVVSVAPNLSEAERASVDEFIADLTDLYDLELTVVEANEPTTNGIHFVSVDRVDLGEEGYFIEIDDAIIVEANNNTALYWSTRTILHILQTNDMSIPKGLTRDYPKWEVRGLLLDVGRKTFTFDFVEQLSREMSWYKLNDFQVHLNDNFIFLELYDQTGEDKFEAYSGYRLESDIEGLANEDVFYTKDQFRSFIKDSRIRGMNIVPEIDVPAHSLAFTKVRPDLALGTVGRQIDHLDVTNPEALQFVKDLFDEYILGDDPVFDADTIVHIGTDEYSTAYSEQFLQFTDDLLEFIQGRDRQVRLWGSLSHFNDEVDVRSENVQMNMWNAGWANPTDMFNRGFDMINMNDGTLYIVPDAGYYYDYLYTNSLYNSWQANNIAGHVIPSGSDQMLGGAFAVWNDMIDKRQTGMSERDIYDRTIHAIPTMAQRLWGSENQGDFATFEENVEIIGKAPQTNLEAEIDTVDENIFVYDFENDSVADKGKNGYDIVEQENVTIEDEALVLNGGTSYVRNELYETKLGTTLQFSVNRQEAADGSEEILFESFNTQIKASINGSGNFGFTREGLDYESNYQLPIGEWVDIALTSRLKVTDLYINGELIHTFTRNDDLGTFNATVLLPVGTIGSETDSFVGLVDNIRLVDGVQPEYNFVNKADLEAAIAEADTYEETYYTSDSWAALVEAYEAGVALLEDPAATQEAIDAQTEAIVEALNNLEWAAEILELDALISAIENAKELDVSLYTEESVADVVEALEAAEALLAQAELQNSAITSANTITQEMVDDAVAALEASIEALVLIEDEVVDPVDPVDPTEPGDEDETEAPADEDDESSLPSTGSQSFAAFAMASILLGAFLLIVKKRQED